MPNTELLKVTSEYSPAGDQPQAIEEIVKSINGNEMEQVLLGVTGSGKTFTMAKIIERVQRPTLILAPNKTLAAQLYGEMKSFFPEKKTSSHHKAEQLKFYWEQESMLVFELFQ